MMAPIGRSAAGVTVAGNVEMIPWDVDIRPLRPRGPMFRFLAWGPRSIFVPPRMTIVEPPPQWLGLIPARPPGRIQGLSVLLKTMSPLDAGKLPIVIDDELVAFMPPGTQPGEPTRDAVFRIIDEQLWMNWQDPRLPEDQRDPAKFARATWCLELMRTLDRRCTPTWSNFHWRVAGSYVVRVITPAIRFSFPKP